jgi:hypothetical protein
MDRIETEKSKILQNTTTTLWQANMARIETEKSKILQNTTTTLWHANMARIETENKVNYYKIQRQHYDKPIWPE